jgi:hypothetical protein
MIETVTPLAPALTRPAPAARGARGSRAERLGRRLMGHVPLLVWLAGAVAAAWLLVHEPPRPTGDPPPSRSLKAAGGTLPR